ncbi:hypothetical protein D1869_14605 [Sulfurisphaera ohwakuensis]|uniref:Uncharacterized protein n=1 Tax=Sulfurisphaera ohwakuensis TaxID=69656 RepID=A0A650CKE6_SULOH|nr:hypothetical protein [Sulfurisphaera ohwakuensis]MBB5254871.1 hypothetical protein [Sulfurisphaera ohwakuensis]QGR18279.1 hypothetical protein D1869_14605 [Sulfurisphaera ohwakuensis]
MNSNRIPNVVVPEPVLPDNRRPDLVVYICAREHCYIFMVIEVKFDTKVTESQAVRQAQNYASILKPLYTVVAGLTKHGYSLIILQGSREIFQYPYNSLKDQINGLIDFLSRNVGSFTASLSSISMENIMSQIMRAPTYERFSRAEFYRIISKTGYYPVSECTIPDPTGMNPLYPDLVVYRNGNTIDCDYPLLVLEFKSNLSKSATSQVINYAKSLLPYYYGEVYGQGRDVLVKIYDRQNKLIINRSIKLGNPYVKDVDVENILSNLPPVPNPTYSPLNGIIHVSQLVQYGAKVSRLSLVRRLGYSIPGFSLDLFEGQKFPDQNYTIVIDCLAKLTRLVFFDPTNSLEWCEFKNGELIKCNIPVDAVMSSSPCSVLFDKIFP